MVIAIDGTAGSGKGTVTKIVADRLNLITIDTGATYRALTLAALRNNLTFDDKEAIINLSLTSDIDFTEDGRTILNGEDVSNLIRSKEVSDFVHRVASIVEVRKNLVKLQRKLAEGKNVIMEGRDITTVVFPNADYKFYIDADPIERANRRVKQNKEQNIDIPFEEVLENIKTRDYDDMHKEYGALVRAEDAIYIDTTNITIEEVVDKIISNIEGE